MRLLTLSAIVSLAGVAAMTGCDGRNAAGPATFSAPGALSRAHATAVSVYVTQANGALDGIVYGYGANNKRNGAPVCTITGQKFDHSQIAVDASGDAYLPNLEASTVGIYGPDCGSPIASVKDPFGADIDVAVGASGTFYAVGTSHVAVCTTGGCASELTDALISQIETAAVDLSGNVWAAYYNQKGTPSLIVWPGAAMPGKPVSGYVNQSTPGDLTFDKKGTLLSLQTLFPHVFIYRCSAATASCTNTKTVTLHAGSLFGALNASNTDYQATDYEGNAVDVYSYPSFRFKYTYNRGLKQGYSSQGIAQTP